MKIIAEPKEKVSIAEYNDVRIRDQIQNLQFSSVTQSCLTFCDPVD